ncbi:hypothetical protein TSOC_001506 [Tetrabaena socialis]|uniref:Uncharacterized protein n=1 Tax=Tetrabaena socialis TaxID=47790 RepID=A0A2J8AGL3_9CHLO|nr:hypothetical protein TSOC_001506 [Tetrabaena socialis]|eukprot:PNH11642.1 hypothetical protein TSOC_001506 [Tetrabaena socialis]
MQEPPSADFFKTYANANATFWHGVAPAITDNYYARTLLGEAAWHEPVGGINASHLAAAQLVLTQFDIVVPLEAPAAVSSTLMSYGAGWPTTLQDVHDKDITNLQEQFSIDPVPYLPSEENLQHLYADQAVDVRLYELAVLLGRLAYLVYSTAAAGGAAAWPGMPPLHASSPEQNPAERLSQREVACALLRGPQGSAS